MTTRNADDTPAPNRLLPERLLYDIEEARQLLGGIGRATLYNLVKRGQLRFVKLGGRRLVHRDDLLRLARGGQ
jgi:excisionase family DNA binding protein